MDVSRTVTSVPVARAPELATFLLQEHVCPGCVLRFLGCSPTVFESPLPSAKAARESLHKGLTGEPPAAGTPAKDGPTTGAAAAEGAEVVCPTCLGILQSLGAGPAGEGADAALLRTSNGQSGDSIADRPSADKGEDGRTPTPASNGRVSQTESAAAAGAELGPGASLCTVIQARVRQSGQQLEDCALEVTMPALLAVRQHALWAHLQQKFPDVPLLQRGCSEAVLSVKDALKYALPSRLEQAVGATVDASSSVHCSLTFAHPDVTGEVAAALGPAKQQSTKRQKGRYGHWKRGDSPADNNDPAQREESLAAVQKALDALSAQQTRDRLPWRPRQATPPCKVEVTCWRSPVFVGGRYLKLVRGLSQSPWLVDEERIGKDSSVQELLAAGIFRHFWADSYKFSSAGREDIDVRMLGRGRPFVLEIQNARVLPPPASYAQMQADVNGRPDKWVAVRDLRLVDRARVELLREGEAEKQKEYVAIVWLPRPATQADVEKLNSMRDLVVQQRTPIRVLHRRSPLIRPRTIHSMRAECVAAKPHYLLLHLCTQAGTYVKEFVHGDLGRTHPNVGSILGCEADILQLDVTDIKMDFP